MGGILLFAVIDQSEESFDWLIYAKRKTIGLASG